MDYDLPYVLSEFVRILVLGIKFALGTINIIVDFYLLRDLVRGNFIHRLRFIFSDAFLDMFAYQNEADDQDNTDQE